MTEVRDSASFLLPPAIAVPGDPEHPLSKRAYREPQHAYRSPFSRDIARILHARAFRRLAGKTQVFTRRSEESDHSRSRLTHTLEVAQIARTLAETLDLNAPLAEALALVHDIGHPPFGHAGEKALDEALKAHALAFDHNLHALRIVTNFEERYPAFPGLNLTLGVREGIIKHSRDYAPATHPELSEYFLDRKPPLEAQLIDLADEIAYLTADIEDGISAGILEVPGLRNEVPLFARFYQAADAAFPEAAPRLVSNEALRRMLNALVTDLMQETTHQLRAGNVDSLDQLRKLPVRLAQLSPAVEAERKQAKEYLYANLYLSPALEQEHTRASEVIHTLFAAWTADPNLLPPDHLARVQTEGAPRAVADYIAGMTDSYIEQAWAKFKLG